MRIKHFSGYGCVNAIKKECKSFTDAFGFNKIKIVIEVSGEHERGLEIPFATSATNWLLKKHFLKNADYKSIESFDTHFKIEKDGKEVCVYTFILNK